MAHAVGWGRGGECKVTKVIVKDGNFERVIRKFKKKVAESGKFQKLRDKEAYEKPTTRRKKALAAAKNRWRKKLAQEKLPEKLY